MFAVYESVLEFSFKRMSININYPIPCINVENIREDRLKTLYVPIPTTFTSDFL